MKHPKKYDTDESTSKRMAKVRLKRGEAEMMLARVLWHHGYRYWLNYKKLPGSPDIAIMKYRIAVFVDGEFWHGYEWEKRKPKLKRNREYWIEKIEENMARDARVDKELMCMGWYSVHFWTEDIKHNLQSCLHSIDELVFDLKMNEMD